MPSFAVHKSWRRLLQFALLLSLLSLLGLLTACPSAMKREASDLDRRQYQYSAAIRWGDFEGAWTMVDPDYRDKHPMTDLDFSRYQQIQVSAYRDLAQQTTPDGTVMREIQIDVVNRNTLSERSMRYTEHWRFDETQKVWWIIGGLPDFWKGQ